MLKKIYLKLNKYVLKRDITDLPNNEHLNGTTVRFSPPVTGLAAFFGSVPPKAGLKKCVAYFFKEAKTAALHEMRPDLNREGGESSKMKEVNLFRKVIL